MLPWTAPPAAWLGCFCTMHEAPQICAQALVQSWKDKRQTLKYLWTWRKNSNITITCKFKEALSLFAVIRCTGYFGTRVVQYVWHQIQPGNLVGRKKERRTAESRDVPVKIITAVATFPSISVQSASLLLQRRLRQGEGVGHVSYNFLGSVGPVEAKQHGIGHVPPARGQVPEQHLQPLSVPVDVQKSISGRVIGSLTLDTLFLGLYWDVLSAQLALLYHLLQGGLLLRPLRLHFATLGVDVQDGGSPYGASTEHAEICGPPVGGRLSLWGENRRLVALQLQFEYIQ